MKNFLTTKSLIISVIALLVCVSVAFAVDTVVNNYYGDVSIGAGENVAIPEEGQMMGAVSAIGGICDGSEPTTQLCNLNAYDFSSQSGITIDAGGIVVTDGESVIHNFRSIGDITQITISTTTSVLTAAQICDSAQIEVTSSTATLAPLTMGIPATTTIFADCLTSNGMSMTFDYVNTTNTSTTLLAGAGIDLESDDANGDIITTGNTAEVTCLRTSSIAARCKIKPFTDAD